MAIKDIFSGESTQEPEQYRGIYEDMVLKGLDLGVAASGNAGEAQPEDRFFKEAYLQALLTPNPGEASSYTVPLRGYKRSRVPGSSAVTWRMYMDYYHLGDLIGLIMDHQRREVPIPEPFIWWTLLCMTYSLCAMENRPRSRTNARPQQDETVVMIDMKPHNMLLEPSDGTRQFPVYPAPLIMDFGSAHLIHPTHPDNDEDLPTTSTQGFVSPEMPYVFHWGEEEAVEGPSKRVDEGVATWTNIWQMGRTLECMMRCTSNLGDPTYDMEDPDFYSCSTIWTDTIDHDGFEYSADLTELVYQCQAYHPHQRPTLPDIMTYIQTHAPINLRGMDAHGTPPWIAAKLVEKVDSATPEDYETMRQSAQARYDAGKLRFLLYWVDRQMADNYFSVDEEVPAEGALEGKMKNDIFRMGRVWRGEDGKLVREP